MIHISSHTETPEQRLMAAVLKQAVEDLRLLRSIRGTSRLAEVEGWFDDQDFRWPFSFENVCAALFLDAEAIRGKIGRLERCPSGVRSSS